MFTFEIQRGRGERGEKKCEGRGFVKKNGVFASRVVPNGVDATTAEWEGGATGFMHAGQGSCCCMFALWKKTRLPPFGNAAQSFLIKCG